MKAFKLTFIVLSVFLFLQFFFILCHDKIHEDSKGWPYPVQGITSQSVQEGPCSSPLPQTASNLNITWLIQERVWYIPAASRSCMALYAEILLGRPAKSIRELFSMCITNPVLSNGISMVNGFGSSFWQQCGPDTPDPEGVKCTEIGGSYKTSPNLIKTENDRIVLTDNESFILNVRCINNEYKDWQLVTTTPIIAKGVIPKVCGTIASLGFNPNWAIRLTCDSNSYGLENPIQNSNIDQISRLCVPLQQGSGWKRSY